MHRFRDIAVLLILLSACGPNAIDGDPCSLLYYNASPELTGERSVARVTSSGELQLISVPGRIVLSAELSADGARANVRMSGTRKLNYPTGVDCGELVLGTGALASRPCQAETTISDADATWTSMRTELLGKVVQVSGRLAVTQLEGRKAAGTVSKPLYNTMWGKDVETSSELSATAYLYDCTSIPCAKKSSAVLGAFTEVAHSCCDANREECE